MYTYTFEMERKVSGSSSPCMRLASLPGEAMNFSVNELGADPRRKLIKNQTNLFVAAERGDVEKARHVDALQHIGVPVRVLCILLDLTWTGPD